MKTKFITLLIALSIVISGSLFAKNISANNSLYDLTPEITASPNPMEFDDTYVGEFTQQLLTVENTGTTTLEVTNVTTTNTSFLVLVNPFDLEPGETQSFIVRFQPISVGYVSAYVQIENNSSVNPYDVAVSGTGLAPAPVISASPNPLVLPDAYIGSSSQNNLYITNTGLATLTISNFVFSDPAFFTYNSPPINIEPGETHDMVIQFAPLELGLIEGNVQFTSNDPANPTYEVQLSGNSIDDPINGWEWHYTGFNYILMDIAFPGGQNQIGYSVGQTYTYNSDGVVIKTTDGGDTWQQMTTGIFPGLEGCSFVTTEIGYAAGWDGYIIKTTDGGATWTELFVASGIYEIIDIEFRDANNGVALSDANVFVTSDGGNSWTTATGFNDVGYQLTYADDNTLYIAANQNNVYKSIDGGYNWTNIYAGGSGILLGLDFLNADYGILAGDEGYIFKTTDGGDSWDIQQINDELFHGVKVWDEDTSWVVGTPDLIYKSTDGGTNYISQYPGYSAWKALYKVVFTDNYTGYICGGSNGIVLKKQGLELAPEITASPESIEFEDTYVGQFVQTLLTIENTGTSTLDVTSVSSTDPAFILSVNPFTLEPGETQSFIVRFQPVTAGYVEGSVQMDNNSSIDPFEVALSGTGLEPVPEISASPDPLVFSDTYISSSSQTNLFITNNGLATLTITEFIFPDPTFETYNNPPINLEPGETHDMVIHFKPKELGLIESVVQYVSNDPINPLYEVQLSGTCIDDPIDGWEWIYTGIEFSFTDIEFPEGQNQIGYASGETASYNGYGAVVKTSDGGDSWVQLTPEGLPGLLNLSFPTVDVGYAAGWDGYLIKTIDGGLNWDTIIVDNSIWLINDVEFWDVNNGIVVTHDVISYVTDDGGQSWTATSVLNNNGYKASYASEDTLYIAGNENFIYKSVDGGLNWTTINSGGPGQILLGVDFLNNDYGYAVGDYGYILRTDDGGNTWEQQNINDELFLSSFIWDADTAWITATPEKIYKTTDGGTTWQSVFNGGWQLAFSTILFTDNYTGFVAANNGVILRKAGIEIAPVITTSPEFIDFEDTYVGQFVQTLLTVENTGTSTLEVTDVTTTDPAFIEAANSFTLEPGETQSFIVRFQPVEAGYVEGFVEIENNSSVNPFQVPLSGTGLEPGPAISATPNPLVLDDTYIGSDSQKNLYITNNGLATLTITDFIFSDDAFFTYNNPPINLEPGETHDMVIKFAPFELGLIEGSVQFISNDPENPAYEVQLSGNGIDDPINGWEWHYTGFNYILMDIAFPEGQNQIGYCAGQSLTYNGEGVVIKTTDGGDTWEQMTPASIDGLQGCSFVSIDTGYAAGWYGYIIKTTDGGETWEDLFVANDIFEISDIEFYDADNGVVIGQGNTAAFAYVTDDGGETWTLGTGIEAACYRVTYADQNTLFIAANNGYIFKSTDGGYNWFNVSTGSGLMLGLDFLNADYGIVTGDNGLILKTTDGGNSWETQAINDNLFHGVFIWDQDTSWIVGTPDLIYKSINGGVSYESQYPAYSAWKALYNVIFTDNYTGFICGGSNGIVLRKQGLEMEPNIAVNPSSVSFPDTYVNEMSTASITVNNTGLATLEVSNIVSTNDAFSVDITSFTVEPGNDQEIEITFTPDVEGLFEGMIQITSNDPETSVFEVTVSGTGIVQFPVIVVEPLELVFDTTIVNQTSIKTLLISNNGNAILDVSNVTSSIPEFTSNLNTFSVEAGNAQELEVTFAPTLQMMYNGILQIESNDVNTGTVEIDLSGYGKLEVGVQSNSNDKILIYPNPAKNNMYITNIEKGEVYLYNYTGNLVLQQTIIELTTKVNITGLAPGTYVLRIIGKSEVVTSKLEIVK